MLNSLRKIKSVSKLKLAVVILVPIGIAFSGQACDPGFQSVKTNMSSQSVRTKSLSVVHSEQILLNMESITGVTASAETKANWAKNRYVFSERGKVNSVNAPMLNALTGLAAEICDDLLDKEMAMDADDRNFFKRVNFDSGPAEFSSSQRREVMRRFARASWSRNETPEEQQMLETALDESDFGDQATETKKIGLFICVSMLSSMDAITL
jgi:hypothetical protein